MNVVERAKNEQVDVLLVDTAGGLQNKVNLMNELEKIKRVIQRELPEAPHETLLVLDATTGQNAMVQAKQFKETTDVTGLVLTKSISMITAKRDRCYRRSVMNCIYQVPNPSVLAKVSMIWNHSSQTILLWACSKAC